MSTGAVGRRRAAHALLAAACTVAGVGCTASTGAMSERTGSAGRVVPVGQLPSTRAERSSYRETSTHADVVAFLDSLGRSGLDAAIATLGHSHVGRAIPYAVASRPLVRTPAEARRLGRPVVYVQANIHGGEVEGKEALLALLRDLLAERRANVLDSIVLVAVPIYNADGNERFGPQERNREEQNGPALVGERANGQGLDLNRDYVKAEAPETRASLAAFAAWEPDVFVDLHTTNGSFHGYALTYAPPLAPVGRAAEYTRDSLLPVLRERMRARHSLETFDYGNFDGTYAPPGTDTTTRSWRSYDHRPRFGTNYVGVRGRVAILSEAYSHDPLERRVRATGAFVREILSLSAERAPALAALARESARGLPVGTPVAIRSRLTTRPSRRSVIAEEVVATGDSTRTEPGMPPGRRRSGRFRQLELLVHDRFEPELSIALPPYYLVAGDTAAVARMLERHGVRFGRTAGSPAITVSRFMVDSVSRARRIFQGHHETRLHGSWSDDKRGVPAGTLIVPTAQPLGALAAYLLEPQSDDGLATWNVLDSVVRPGAEFPVVRASGSDAVLLRLVP